MSYTTIQISPETREKLSRLKTNRETYDELLESLLELVPAKDDEGEYTEEFKASLLRSLRDIKQGKVYSMQEIKKMLGIKNGV